ncbi:MAG: Glu/Leu/Phe/Val dehydrogenase [Dehalococcoidia bacterium]|nr:Glu/Leu/Phe/Val dehydrogenase [Dehalococcoidia bacterium]
MQILDFMEANGHEQLAVWTDPGAGLRAFIAIHDTTLGPSLGGTRVWPHPTEEDALFDVLRLSQAMTYKSAAAGLDFGGGKALIMADPRADKTEAMFRSYGRFVESLGGRYVTTEDVGSTPYDLAWSARETRHVVGLPVESGGSGNPSTMTGYGLYEAMRAAAKARWGSDDLAGRTVALQGFGNVASSLAEHLLGAGARLVAADVDPAKVERAAARGAAVAGVDEILAQECDILAPCALGGVLNERSIPALRCEVICGAANNQLLAPEDAERLRERGILYAPDYIVNAGGVINVSFEVGREYDQGAARAKTAQIYDTLERVFAMAEERGVTTAAAADLIAEERLAAARAARA